MLREINACPVEYADGGLIERGDPPLHLKTMSPLNAPPAVTRQNRGPLGSVSKSPFWPAGNDTLTTYEPPGGKPLDPTDIPDSSGLPGVPQDPDIPDSSIPGVPDVPGSGNPASPFEPDPLTCFGPEDLLNSSETGAVDALLISNQRSCLPSLPTVENTSINFSTVFNYGSSVTPSGDEVSPFAPSVVDDLSGEAPSPIAYGAAVYFSGSKSRRTTK